MIRIVILITVVFYIFQRILPVAREKKVSSTKWMFISLGAFYGVFFTMLFGSMAVVAEFVVAPTPGDAQAREKFFNYVGAAMVLGLGLGAFALYRIRKYLLGLETPASRRNPFSKSAKLELDSEGANNG